MSKDKSSSVPTPAPCRECRQLVNHDEKCSLNRYATHLLVGSSVLDSERQPLAEPNLLPCGCPCHDGYSTDCSNMSVPLTQELRALRQQIEDTIAVAQTESDDDGFIKAYHFKTGAIHRLLAVARKGEGHVTREAWSPKQREHLADFQREMEENVIPAIQRDMEERAELAEDARHRVMIHQVAEPRGEQEPMRCVKCGHRATLNGLCEVGIPERGKDRYGYNVKCGCKCEFAAPAPASPAEDSILIRAQVLASQRKAAEQADALAETEHSAVLNLKREVFMNDVSAVLNGLRPLFQIVQERRGGDVVPRWTVHNEAGLCLLTVGGYGWGDIDIRESGFNGPVWARCLRSKDELKEALANAISRYF